LLALPQSDHFGEQDITWIGEHCHNSDGYHEQSFDLVYCNLGLNSIFNLQDAGYSITPEFLYTGCTSTEMRLRLVFLQGGSNSELLKN